MAKKRKVKQADKSLLVVKYLPLIPAVVGLAFIVLFLVVALRRVSYPFELEWMEGAIVDHVIRILNGQEIYVAPSLEFIPFIYTPLYFYLGAVFSKIFGIGFFSLRLLSILAAVGSFAVIFQLVRKVTENIWLGLTAAGIFAACYHLSGGWFDIARTDSLFVFLLLSSIYLLRFHREKKLYILAGVILCLAFLAKQTALVISLPLMVFVLYQNWKLGLYFAVSALGLIGLTSLLFNWFSDGWYYYYVFFLPRQHELNSAEYLGFWLNDIFKPLAICFVIMLVFFVRKFQTENKTALFYLCLALGLFGGAWLGKLHSGGFLNVLIPAHAALAIFTGLGFGAILKYGSDRKFIILPFIAVVVLLGQFYLLFYDPGSMVPTEMDREYARKFIDSVARVPGEVIITHHGYYGDMAGKRSYAHKMAINDVLRADDDQKPKLLAEIDEALKHHRFTAVIIDAQWYQDILDKYYKLNSQIYGWQKVFIPVTGFKLRPLYLYVPKTPEDTTTAPAESSG